MNRFLATILALVFAATTAQAQSISFSDARPSDAAVLVLPISGSGPLTEAAEQINSDTDDSLVRAIDAAAFSGNIGEHLTLYGMASYDRLVLIGVGDQELTNRDLKTIGEAIAKSLDGVTAAAVHLDGLQTQTTTPAAHVALGVRLGAYRSVAHKSEPENSAVDLTFIVPNAGENRNAYEGDLEHVANAVVFARDLINAPGNVIYPESFVERVRGEFRGVPNVRITVLDPEEMRRLNMGALLGVGQGSAREPRLLVVRYDGAEDSSDPVAFVGKGVTFDTGGISLKDGSGMWRMKYDMSGAAASVGAVLAIAKREAPVNVIAVAALAENMPGANAQRPGDIVTTMSGQTVEVLNTDAEGRLLLADAVWYVQQEFNPQILVNLATLTGSVRVALGDEYAGLYSRHDDIAGQLIAAGQTSGDEVWRMPLHPSVRAELQSNFADIKNIVEGGIGGANIGAQFVGYFVDPQTRWAHLDIASTAWDAQGSTGRGWGVMLLDQLVRDHYEQ